MITSSGQCLKTNGTEKEKDNSSTSHVLHHRKQKFHEKVSYSLLIGMYRETKKSFRLIWCQLSLSLNPFHFMFCMYIHCFTAYYHDTQESLSFITIVLQKFPDLQIRMQSPAITINCKKNTLLEFLKLNSTLTHCLKINRDLLNKRMI